MEWGLLWPWRGAAAAFPLALAVALLARRRIRLAALAAGIGILAGWWTTFGLLTATPRQLPERLPLLALLLLIVAGLGGRVAARWRWTGLLVAALGTLAAGWWMAGAPRAAPDLVRAAPALAAVSALSFLLAIRLGPRAMGPVASGVLLAALVVAAAPGPGPVLAAAVFAATAGAWAGRVALPGLPSALPVAGAVAALAAMPVIARGAPADWAAGAAPLAAVWLGPALSRRGPRWLSPALAAVAVAVPLLAVSFFLR